MSDVVTMVLPDLSDLCSWSQGGTTAVTVRYYRAGGTTAVTMRYYRAGGTTALQPRYYRGTQILTEPTLPLGSKILLAYASHVSCFSLALVVGQVTALVVIFRSARLVEEVGPLLLCRRRC